MHLNLHEGFVTALRLATSGHAVLGPPPPWNMGDSVYGLHVTSTHELMPPVGRVPSVAPEGQVSVLVPLPLPLLSGS